MDQKTLRHYFQVWSLLESLKEPFWSAEEKENIKQTLKDITAADVNLQEIDIASPDFLDKLKIKLQALLTSQPEAPTPNLPPPGIFQDYEAYLQQLSQKEKETRSPIVFLKDRKPLVLSEKIYQILKGGQLADEEGETNLDQAPEDIRAQAEKKIGELLTYQRWRSYLRQKITFSLEGNVPLTLFSKEFFGVGEIGEIPGIIDQTSEELITAIKEGKDFDYQKIPQLVKTYIEASPKFALLSPARQQEIQQKTGRIVATEIQKFQLHYPKQSDRVVIGQKGEDFYLTVIPPQEEKYSISSAPIQPKTIAERIQRESNLPSTIQSTENIQRFIRSFAEDPIKAVFEYPYYSFINLLPGPIKKSYWNKKKMEKNWKLWYGISISPDAQRQALQDLGWRAIKACLKPSGLVNENGQWVWMSAIGWLGEKAVTGIGELFANLSEKLGKPGKAFGKILHRRVGKERKREESLLTGFLGVILDTTTRLLGFLFKKIIWDLIKNLPIVKKIGELWVNFRCLLESKLPFLKYLRIGGSIIGSLIRAAPHGLISGGLGYLASGGNIGWTITAGASDWIFHFLKNLGGIPEVSLWIKSSHTTVVGRLLAGAISNQWFYLPVKGAAFSFIFTDTILPALGVNLPTWARWLVRFGITGTEYIWKAGIQPFLKLNLPPFIAEWITGPLGFLFNLFLSGLPASFVLPQILVALGVNPFLAYFLGIFGGPLGLGLFLKLTGLLPYSIFSWPGMWLTGWLAGKLGITGLGAGLMQLVGILTGPILGKWIITALLSGIWSALGLPALGAGVGGFGIGAAATGISASAVLATGGTILLVAGLTFLTIIIVSGAFNPRIQEILAPPTSECFAPTKTVEILDKNTHQPKARAEPGDILRYTISFGAKKDEIKNVVLKDEFREAESFTSPIPGQSWIKTYVDPGTFRVIQEPIHHAGPSRVTEQRSSGSVGYQEFWQRVVWEKFSVTPSSPNIIYEIKISDKYQGGTILNQILLNGDWAEIIEEEYTDPVTGENKIKQIEKKAKCQVATTAYVNSGTKEAAELAVAIINELKKYGIGYVNRNNLSSQVEPCLSKIGIPPVVIEQFRRSVNNPEFNGNLQCVGFINALEAATGGTLQNVSLPNARSYWKTIEGYQRKYRTAENKNDLRTGDILIWTNNKDGHVAIVVQPVFDFQGQLAKIIIAEAIGSTGEIRLREITYDNPGLAGWQRRK